jgi:hypothetical protein
MGAVTEAGILACVATGAAAGAAFGAVLGPFLTDLSAEEETVSYDTVPLGRTLVVVRGGERNSEAQAILQGQGGHDCHEMSDASLLTSA